MSWFDRFKRPSSTDKYCAGCGMYKEIYAFGKNSKNTDGLQKKSKLCLKTATVKNKLKNVPDEIYYVTLKDKNNGERD